MEFDMPAALTTVSTILLGLAPFFIALSGIAIILQLKSLANNMLATCFLSIFLALGLQTLAQTAPGGVSYEFTKILEDLPRIFQWLIIAGAIWVASLFVVALLGLIAAPIIGRRAADSMKGNLAAGFFRATLFLTLAPFRLLRRILRGRSSVDND